MKKVLFIPDMHGKMLHMPSWRLLLNFAKDFQPDRTVQLGDIVDVSGIGKFPVNSKDLVTLRTEYDFVNDRLDELENVGAGVTDLTEGNHEERLRRAGTIAETLEAVVDPRYWLRVKERNINWVPYHHDVNKGTVRLGNLRASHGFWCNKYSARFHAAAFGNWVGGHTHRIQALPADHSVGSAMGYHIGWLGSEPSWVTRQPPRNWANGFAFAYVHNSGKFQLYQVVLQGQNITINDNLYKRI